MRIDAIHGNTVYEYLHYRVNVHLYMYNVYQVHAIIHANIDRRYVHSTGSVKNTSKIVCDIEIGISAV